MKIFKFVLLAGLLISGFSAHAEIPNSKFTCSYKSGRGPAQTVTFAAPEGIDLTNPLNHLSTIPLTINGEAESTIFNVAVSYTKVGYKITYSYRNPFFVSDIAITYEKEDDALGGSVRFTGVWSTDYPPTLKMICSF